MYIRLNLDGTAWVTQFNFNTHIANAYIGRIKSDGYFEQLNKDTMNDPNGDLCIYLIFIANLPINDSIITIYHIVDNVIEVVGESLNNQKVLESSTIEDGYVTLTYGFNYNLARRFINKIDLSDPSLYGYEYDTMRAAVQSNYWLAKHRNLLGLPH